MKVKTSITLPDGLLDEIDSGNPNPSAFLEHAARIPLNVAARRTGDSRDAAILERSAERLNREAAEVLDYQDFPDRLVRDFQV